VITLPFIKRLLYAETEGDTVNTFSRLLLGCWILSTVGCSASLPETYSKIEIGKPLDRSALPDVVIDDEGSHVSLWELQQYPLAWKQWDLTAALDPAGNVTSLKIEESTSAYWVLGISRDAMVRKRTPDSQGGAREQVEPPSSSFLWFFDYWYGVGVAGTFGFSGVDYEQKLVENRKARAAGATATTRPAAALTK
jgi:hypothetical protein